MNAQAKVTTPTPSQFASAAMHLDNQIKHVRYNGIRFAIIESGNSGHVYRIAAPFTSCPCRWFETTRTQCSHLLALELLALEQDLIEQAESATLYDAIWQRCRAVVCQDLADSSDNLCWRHASEIEYQQRLASRRAAGREMERAS